MLVPKTACRSAVFIGSVNPDSEFIPRATGFLVSAATYQVGSVFFPYLVTAEHVVTGMQSRGMAIHCRINLKDGGTAIVPLDGKWWFHPPGERESDLQTDVAVMPFGLRLDLVDHEYISVSDRPDHIDRIPRLGEEVFVMGLFKSHHGQRRNIPIIRIGNIAALPEEPVTTSYCGPTDAYLVEVRSIAGLSGSPVFKNAEGLMPYPKQPKVYPSKVWTPDEPSGFDESIRLRQNPALAATTYIQEVMETRRKREEIDWFDWQFVGLVHGHFDVKDFTEDAADVGMEDAIGKRNEINTGIAIVIPARKVLETLFQHDLQKEQWNMIRKNQEERGATADADLSESSKLVPVSAKDEANPNHQEDFTRLLGAAAKAKPLGD